MSRTFLHGAVLLDPEAARPEPGSLLVEDGRIQARLRHDAPAPQGTARVDLAGLKLAPGFVDLHFHGRVIFAEDEVLARALADDALDCVRHGVTAFLATSVAFPSDRLRTFVTRLAESMTRSDPAGADPLGIHLEGPWISGHALGAQPRDGARPFDPREGADLLDRGEGAVRMVTLAPELEGAGDLIDELGRRGIIAALGHSAATAAEARSGIDRGIAHVTHLFNALAPVHHRAPGAAGTALSDDRVTCDLICDGVHVDPAMVRVAARSKGERMMLISDRMTPMSDEGYASFGAGTVRDDGTALRLADGRLAGSRLTLDRAASNYAKFSGFLLLDAVAACTLRPARMLGLESERGTLRPGARADFAVLDDAFCTRQTWIGGRRVYPPPVEGV